MSERRKVTVVGAGNVGATCAQVLATRDYADVVLVDIKEGLPQGKELDVNQMGAVLGYEPNLVGSNRYDESAGSAVVVITAGLPRSPGMSRDDLVATARQQEHDPLAFIRNRDLFGDLIESERFVSTYKSVLSSLHHKGARATLEDLPL